MGIPAHTRIVLIPSDENPTREFGISRPMLILLAVLALALAVLLGLLLASFAGKHDERQRIAELESELDGARSAVAMAGELAVELEQMKEAQERLLFLFGVQDAAEADSILAEAELDYESDIDAAPASAQVAMSRAAAVVLNDGPERWPARGLVTQEFKSGNLARNIKPHQGIDIAGPLDTPILAAADGRVVRAGTDEYLGNVVEIEHGLGYLTVYGHCSRLAVRAGDAVQSGQLVAYMGTSGQSTAVHLHFEIWRQGEAVDPRTVLSGEPSPN